MRKLLSVILQVNLVCFGLATWSWAQQACPQAPVLQPIPANENMFTDAQEVDLGDAMSENIALHLNVISNDELTAHLREIGDRLIRYLPPTQLKFRFYLVDLPSVNAFSIAGGRVYVSRKLVAFVQNDDELAGVLAHELGHIVTHQTAIQMTRSFREVLNVTQVGDRDDIFRKWHQYVENVSRSPRAKHNEGEKHQVAADQVEVFTIARAGFSTQAAAELWDRFNQLHGKSGNWFTDLVGSTTSAQHRLREILKNTATLPSACIEHPPAADKNSFVAWQQAVVDFEDNNRAEITPGLVLKRRFTERLRPEITNLRFSPDGKYILAQDDGGVNVITYKPFAFVFYIPAPDAHDARFSPDSNSIVFVDADMRVENWSLPEQKRKSVHEIVVRAPCLQTELSPDGKTLACLNSERALQLIDVMNGAVLQEDKAFWTPSGYELLSILLSSIGEGRDEDSGTSGSPRFINMAFTPDSRYFVAGYGATPEPHLTITCSGGPNCVSIEWYADHAPGFLMFDTSTRSKVSAPSSIKGETAASFSFLGTDQMVGINPGAPQKSHILKFPSGETVGDVELWSGMKIRGVTHGNAILVGPLKDYPLGIIDLTTKERKVVIRQNTADMYDGVLVTERISGQLALHNTTSENPIAVLQLPEGNLGRLRAAATSPDLNYLAVSSRTRAAVWDVSRDFRALQMRRFSAVGFDGAGLYVDLPKVLNFSRQTAEIHLDTGAHSFHELKEGSAIQHGLYLSVVKPRNKKGYEDSNSDLEMRDIRTGKALWSRYFPADLPSMTFQRDDATLMFRWRMPSAGAKDEIKRFSSLPRHLENGDYVCETVDANSGQTIATFALKINSGSLHFENVRANRHWAVAQAAGDQVLTYALPSGEEKTSFFGLRPVLSVAGMLAIETGKREISLYDLSKTELVQQYSFSDPISFKTFSADGKRLLVFTNNQTVYLLDLSAAGNDAIKQALN